MSKILIDKGYERLNLNGSQNARTARESPAPFTSDPEGV